MEKKRHSRGVSRRGVLKTGGALVAAGGLAGVPGIARAKKGGRDLALVNGKIHTMDGANRVVSSALIRNGRFVDVGSGLGAQGGNVKVINLQGKTVIPGIVDSHNHIVLVGNRPGHHVIVEDLFSIPDVIARYQLASRNVPEGEFITTIGVIAAMQLAENRLPNLTELDAVNRPVFIFANQGGAVTNSLGKAWFAARGVTSGIAADGTVTDTTSTLLLLRQQMLTDELRVSNTLAALQFYTTLGVTLHHDQGAFQSDKDNPSGAIANEDNFTMYDSFLTLHSQGLLPARMRINYLFMDQDPESQPLSDRLKNAFQFYGDDMFKTGSIGEFVAPDPTDPMQLTTAGFPPVANTANNTRWLFAAMKVAKAGWRAEVHSLTATDFKAEIDGYLLVNQQFPIDDLRWVVAHVPHITPDYIEKLKSINGGLKVGSFGPTRTGVNVGPPQRTILDSGIRVCFHSDGGDFIPINPWLDFYSMVTGKNLLGALVNEGQTLTRDETMFLATSATKWFIGEDDIGTIEVGNHGDFVVLDRDYFSVDVEQIPHIRSLLTVVGGNVVYDAGAL